MKTLHSLFAKGKRLVYKKKSIVISPTATTHGMYYVEDGFLYGYSTNKRKSKRIQIILKPGDVFPLIQATKNFHHPFFLEALTDTTVSVINRDLFFTQMYKDHDLSKEFIAAVTTFIYRYVGRVENLELEKLSQKVIGRLLYFALHFGKNEGTKIVIDIPVTQTFIAESINVSRSNVSREVTKLEKEKLISFEGKYLTILNYTKLAKKIS